MDNEQCLTFFFNAAPSQRELIKLMALEKIFKKEEHYELKIENFLELFHSAGSDPQDPDPISCGVCRGAPSPCSSTRVWANIFVESGCDDTGSTQRQNTEHYFFPEKKNTV